VTVLGIYYCILVTTVDTKDFLIKVRRMSANCSNYSNINGIQSKYRTMSILKKPRMSIFRHNNNSSKNKEESNKSKIVRSANLVKCAKRVKQRRDHTEVREKTASKSNMLWSTLGIGSIYDDCETMKETKIDKKRKWMVYDNCQHKKN
jgi:hypothetical protein